MEPIREPAALWLVRNLWLSVSLRVRFPGPTDSLLIRHSLKGLFSAFHFTAAYAHTIQCL